MDMWIKEKQLSKSKWRKLYGESYLVFIDWKSAFDLVSHNKLILILKELGVSDRTVRLVEIILYYGNLSVDGKTSINVEKGTP